MPIRTERRWPRALGALLVVSGLVACGAEGSDPAPEAEETTSAAAEPAARDCGTKGRPDCPTQAWMKATVQPFLVRKDGPRLEEALRRLGAAAPPGYQDWTAIAEGAADAARAGDFAAVRRSCSSCHDRHRAKFREEMRGAAIISNDKDG